MVDLDRDESQIDIHHIFPRRWCEQQGIPSSVFNSIVNKTAISYRANRMIGGNAPSLYLEKLRNHPQVQLSLAQQDAMLSSHLIEPDLLRSDDFEAFYSARKKVLLAIIEKVMGKPGIVQDTEPPPADADEEIVEEVETTA